MTDLWGQIYTDEWRGESHPHVFHRDDGNRNSVSSAAGYFVAPRGDADRAALDALAGRVLDLGCGAGSYALYLMDRRCEVVAVDASPGAIAVSQGRGVRTARVLGIDDVGPALGTFDAIICMGNTLGIGAGPDLMPARLQRLRSILSPNGKLVAAMIDPLATEDPAHLAYHERNRQAGRPPGLARAYLEYRGVTGDWWELWMPTPQELRAIALATGWTVARAVPEGISVLYELEQVKSR